MKKLLSLLFFFTFTTSILQAQKLDNSLLWEISGNGLEQSSYLFGTIHLTCDASLNDRIKKALDDTSLLVLELDMDDPQMQMQLMQHINMKDGQSVKDMLSPEDFQALDSFFKEQVGMSFVMFNTMKPYFAYSMLYPKFIDCPMQSFEMALMNVAHAQEEEVLGLETVEDQTKVFDEIPYEDQLADLMRSVKDNMASDKESFSEMLEIYASEKIEDLYHLIDEDQESALSAYTAQLLDNRNKNWISKMSTFMKEQPTFFGVGAGHLAGQKGVINLLKEKGYTVKAVK